MTHQMTVVAEGDTDLRVRRRFDAPPELVFRAHTDPAIVPRWLTGPDGWTMTDCQIDLRPGGRYRYVWSDGQGTTFAIFGEFLEITPPSHMVHTEIFEAGEGDAGAMEPATVTSTFAADGSGTRMELVMSYTSAEARAASLESGMEEGMSASYDRLDEAVAAVG